MLCRGFRGCGAARVRGCGGERDATGGSDGRWRMRGVSRHARRSFVPGRICDRGLEISRTTGRAVLIGGGWGRGANAFHRTPIKTTRADRSNRTNHQTLPRHRQKGPRQGVGHASITERGHRSFGGSRCNLLRALGSASLSTPPSPHRPGPPLPMASRAVMLGGARTPPSSRTTPGRRRAARRARVVATDRERVRFALRSSPRSACSRGVASRGASVARIAGCSVARRGRVRGRGGVRRGPRRRARAPSPARRTPSPPSAAPPATAPLGARATRWRRTRGGPCPRTASSTRTRPSCATTSPPSPPATRAPTRRGPAEEPAEPARVPGADENLPEVEDLSSDASGSRRDLARTTRADAQAEVDAQIEEEMRKIEEATKREDERRDTRGGGHVDDATRSERARERQRERERERRRVHAARGSAAGERRVEGPRGRLRVLRRGSSRRRLRLRRDASDHPDRLLGEEPLRARRGRGARRRQARRRSRRRRRTRARIRRRSARR